MHGKQPDLTLTDGEVVLSPLRLDDAAAHLAGEDAELVRWLNGGPGTRATVDAHLRWCEEQWETLGPVRAFGVRVAAGAVLAGTIEVQFGQAGLAPGQVNIAYGLYPAWRGRGLATRAVLLACRYAARAGAAEAVIRAEPENAASVAVARRCGFGYLGRSVEDDGARLDWFVRGLAASDPAPAGPAGV
ncbi:GNAT family N-acetyltransferase [Streptomyces sp. B1866]|uniref:GNAT family N-acetyltransferase n=1 Tax=Streptomyces sp. B1866 TaxID=3075431 RepID=UPI002890B461|nr:GNAT family N-acetyltransferase [Streptomyces sp. B1866]MDT3396589.1 GNAT family N-acetyltransferase [Streptomyces sp. B1866]